MPSRLLAAQRRAGLPRRARVRLGVGTDIPQGARSLDRIEGVAVPGRATSRCPAPIDTLPAVEFGGAHQLVLSRPLQAGPLDFVVGSPDPTLVRLAEELFRDLPSPRVLEGELPCFVLAPSAASREEPLYDLSGPVVGLVEALPLSMAVSRLVTALSRATLDAEPDRLHLHAAAAVRDGRAVVLAAPRETGKTTTLARLVLDGWSYVSDETVSIGPGDELVRGFAKPLSIKPGSRSLLPELAPHFLPEGTVGDHAVLHVSLGTLGVRTAEAASAKMVGLLRRRLTPSIDHAADSRPIHPADAVVGLMAETLDAARFGNSAVIELARLAARTSCWEIFIGAPNDTVVEIERLFEMPPGERLDVQQLPQGGPRIPANVTSVLVGDRAVVHELPEGRILALDATATQIWLNLGDWPAAEKVDLRGPVVASFIGQLLQLGLVTGEPAP